MAHARSHPPPIVGPQPVMLGNLFKPLPDVRRLRSLDGLRGLAALAVLGYHFSEPLAYYGLMGVELFFVISGFVILMTLERVGSLTEFAIGRAGRLYPAYWVSVAVAGLFLWLTHQATAGLILINATMLQAFFLRRNIIDPYWTLAFELVFYVAMAAVFRVRQLPNIDRVALAWLAIMVLFRGAMLSGKGWGLYNNWTVQFLLMPQFGHLFIAGMMLYRINTGRATLPTRLALGLAVLYSLFGRPDWAQIEPIPYFLINAVFIAAVWAASSGRAPVLAIPVLAGIGLCSYSLYLFHVPVQLLFAFCFGQLSEQLWFFAMLVFPTAIGTAVIIRAYIEQPAQLLVKKWAAHFQAATKPASKLIPK
jgi:peptidoglycan/LPS O-acetylase OafA/YrhL